jgi:hypothetical protein
MIAVRVIIPRHAAGLRRLCVDGCVEVHRIVSVLPLGVYRPRVEFFVDDGGAESLDDGEPRRDLWRRIVRGQVSDLGPVFIEALQRGRQLQFPAHHLANCCGDLPPERILRVAAFPDGAHSLGGGKRQRDTAAMWTAQAPASGRARTECVPDRLPFPERKMMIASRVEIGDRLVPDLID